MHASQGRNFQAVTRMKSAGGVQTIQALDIFNGGIKAKRDPRKRVTIDNDVLRIGRLRLSWISAKLSSEMAISTTRLRRQITVNEVLV